MSKKRRTKKQKIAALERHTSAPVTFVQSSPSPSISALPEYKSSEVTTTSRPETIRAHTYVVSDIRNTLLITTVIIAINVAIFMVLKLNLVNLFGIMF